ncbi:MAG TPA: LPS export ABC transporter permease LptG [Bradyrhizobium sp.]|nr:LPS export ABC transporter permease LptG [Bradyrhizobium sp.]
MLLSRGTLGRYFGLRFLSAVCSVFAGMLALIALIDYIELMRRTGDLANVSALMIAKTSFYRVPQIAERLMPFCVLVGAMSCFLNLSRRMELVIARAAGMSAWQFVSPAVVGALVLGTVATTLYNPLSASLQEQSKRLEAEVFGNRSGLIGNSGGYWVRQRTADGQSIINALSSQEQGVRLGGVTVFSYSASGQFQERIEAKTAVLQPGFWQLENASIYATGLAPRYQSAYRLNTNLTPEQVRESFATPETVSFWQLPLYIQIAEHSGLAAAAYRLQYHKLLSRPFMLAAMVLLAAAFSLRFFRFGGVQKMVLGGVGSGFLLYVLSKVTEDLSKAELMHPMAAAWLPVLVGGLTGFVALLYQEDG